MDAEKRRVLVKAGRMFRDDFLAPRWSGRRFVKVVVVLLVLWVVGNAAVAVFNPSWREQVTFQTERTEVTITAVDDEPEGSCGRNHPGVRQEIEWSKGGETRTGWYIACGDAQQKAVGHRFTAWPVEGGRAYDWHPIRMWLAMTPVLLFIAAVITLIGGTKLEGEDGYEAQNPHDQSVRPGED